MCIQQVEQWEVSYFKNVNIWWKFQNSGGVGKKQKVPIKIFGNLVMNGDAKKLNKISSQFFLDVFGYKHARRLAYNSFERRDPLLHLEYKNISVQYQGAEI